MLSEVAGASLSHDSAGRETDIAFDQSEFAHMPVAQIAKTLQIMDNKGMNASVSSIHINGWFDAPPC